MATRGLAKVVAALTIGWHTCTHIWNMQKNKQREAITVTSRIVNQFGNCRRGPEEYSWPRCGLPGAQLDVKQQQPHDDGELMTDEIHRGDDARMHGTPGWKAGTSQVRQAKAREQADLEKVETGQLGAPSRNRMGLFGLQPAAHHYLQCCMAMLCGSFVSSS